MRVFRYVFEVGRVVHASLGLKREAFGLVIVVLLIRFYEPVRGYLAAQGFAEVPDVPAMWSAAAFVGVYLYLHLLSYAVALQGAARPGLVMRILDPSQRYDTYVALGNRVVRLFHLEVENLSASRTARKVSVTLVSYHLTGDKKVVDIRSKLKVANSDAEELDLNPRARVAFELGGVVANGGARVEPAEERDSQTFSILPAGSGTVRVMAGGANVPAIEERYTLYIDSAGTMTIRPQAEVSDLGRA
jgi:hypothetical protein